MRFYLCARGGDGTARPPQSSVNPTMDPGPPEGSAREEGRSRTRPRSRGLLLSTEAMVAEKPKEEKPATPPMPHGAEDF